MSHHHHHHHHHGGQHKHGGQHGRWHWHRHGWFRRGGRWGGLSDYADSMTPDPTVSSAQACLAQTVDPSVPQDGTMGPETRQAIQTFQSQQGLPPSGTLDPNTMNALQAACSQQQQGSQQPPGGGGGGPQAPQQEAFLGDILGGVLNPLGGIVGGLFGGGGGDGSQPPAPPAPGPFPLPPPGPFPFPPPFQAPFPDFGGDRWRGDRWRRDRFRRGRWRRELEAEGEFRRGPGERGGFDFRGREPFRGYRGRFGWGRDRGWLNRPWDRRYWGAGAPVADPQIVWAQSCLAQVLGSWVVQDGIMGPATQGAIRTFQQQQQLPPTGVLDEATVNALQSACGSSMPA